MRLPRLPAAGGVLLCLATTASAAGFDGEYRAAPDWDCQRVGEPGGAISLRDNRLRGIDSTCHIVDQRRVSGMSAVIADVVCGTVAGVLNERRILMRTADGGLVMLRDGEVVQYERCPETE
jgi:hypothetical protein